MSSALSAFAVVVLAVSAGEARTAPVVRLASAPAYGEPVSAQGGPGAGVAMSGPQGPNHGRVAMGAGAVPYGGPVVNGGPVPHGGPVPYGGPVPHGGPGVVYGGPVPHSGCTSCGPVSPCPAHCGMTRYGFWTYWGLIPHHCPPGNLHQHIPYIAYPKDYYYFRPYNYFQIPDQQQEVMAYGDDPRDPYTNRVFERVYSQFPDASGQPITETLPPAAR